MTSFIAIDLGGTNVRLGLVAEGAIVETTRFPTQAQAGPADLLDRLAKGALGIRELARRRGLEAAGLGVASPGVLDRTAGVVRLSPNLPGWRDIPLAGELARLTGLPVALENDANLYALGESRFGAGRGHGDLACLTLGTGVGGGLILGGRLVVGPLGCGGELGHMVVEPRGRLCGCGAQGCLEAYASATGLEGALAEELSRGRATSLKPGDDPRAVALAAEAGDELARELFVRAGLALGRAAANLVILAGLNLIILGGGLAASWPLMEPAARRELSARLRIVDADRVRLVPGSLGDQAALLGAAAWAAESLRQ